MKNKNLNSFTIEAVSSNGILDNVISAFWREHQYDPFSQSQIIFYFYLIGLAISRNMKMPVKCHTNTVANLLHISSQSILKARIGLFQRGLIDFSKGNGNQDTPRYYLILDPIQWIEKTDEDSSTIIENSIKVSKKSSSKTNDDFNETLDNQVTENGVANTPNPTNEILNDGSNNPINSNEGNPNSEHESSFNNTAQSSESNPGMSGSESNSSSIEDDISTNGGNEVQTVPQSPTSNPSNENQYMRIVDMRVNFLQDEAWLQSIYNAVSPFVKVTMEDIKRKVDTLFNNQKYDSEATGNIVRWKNDLFDDVCHRFVLSHQPKINA